MSTDEQVKRKARVLAAFMSQAEAGGFAGSFSLDPTAFMAKWVARTGARAGLARGYTAPRVEDIDEPTKQHVAKVQAHKLFHAVYKNVEFKMIELGKVLAFQHWMDTDVSDGVHGAGNPATPTPDVVREKCLPPNVIPDTRMMWMPSGDQNHMSVTIFSLNNTLGFQPGMDQANGIVRFVVAAGANLMMVREFNGRYVLANGYHRAWWLRSRGIDMVPVVLMHVSSEAQLTQPGFIQADILSSDQPPIIDHFLDDKFSMTDEVRAMVRAVKITAEVSMVPRLI